MMTKTLLMTAVAAVLLATAPKAHALTGDVTGFTGPLEFSKWTQYGSPQNATVIYSTLSPNVLALQNYQPWADSWAWVAPPAATQSGEYTFNYSGARTGQCPGNIILPDNSWHNLPLKNGVARVHVAVGQTFQIALRGSSEAEGVCHPGVRQIQLIITNLKFLADYP